MAYLEDNRGRSSEEYMITSQKGSPRPIWTHLERRLSLLILAFMLIVWEWLIRSGAISPLFFPAPTAILRTLGRWLTSDEMFPHLGMTLFRVFLGFALGGLLGLIVGLIIGWSRRISVVVDPFIAATHPIPKIAILPLIMLVFGIGEISKLILIAIVAFFPMLINTAAGVRQINPVYFQVVESYGASPIRVFARIVIPGCLPLILTGVRLSLNISLLITIVVELVAAQRGLGTLIWSAWQTLRTEELYASLVIAAALGVSLNFLLQYVQKRMIPWELGEKG